MNPAEALYGSFAGIRNRLYDQGLLQTERLAGPVISVGNLSLGGSGKTPFVIMLGETLKQRGISFDVLSRGYGRKTRGVHLIDASGPPSAFGDEPLLIARRVGCPVIVGESRYRAGIFAESKFGPQLHILDDGFQHRALGRSFDIVLLTPEDIQDRLLPAGRLREPLSSLRRADAVVLTGELDSCDLPLPAKVWRVRRELSIANVPPRPVAFCGIARPQAFIQQLRTSGIQPVATRFYRDHHAYTSSDVRQLSALRDQNRAAGFITTEKDAINLGPLLAELAAVAIARVVMELEPADAVDTILSVVPECRPSA